MSEEVKEAVGPPDHKTLGKGARGFVLRSWMTPCRRLLSAMDQNAPQHKSNAFCCTDGANFTSGGSVSLQNMKSDMQSCCKAHVLCQGTAWTIKLGCNREKHNTYSHSDPEGFNLNDDFWIDEFRCTSGWIVLPCRPPPSNSVQYIFLAWQ